MLTLPYLAPFSVDVDADNADAADADAADADAQAVADFVLILMPIERLLLVRS